MTSNVRLILDLISRQNIIILQNLKTSYFYSMYNTTNVYMQGRREPAQALERLIGTGPRGFGGAAPRKFSVTTPLSLPENEGHAPFKNNYSKKIASTFRVTAIENIESRTSFMLVMPCSHQVVAVA